MDKWLTDLLSPSGALLIFNIGFFIAWYFTFKRANEAQDKSRKEITELFRVSDQKYSETTNTIIQLLKEDTEHKLLLSGILDRLISKLEHPIVCPMALGDKGDRV